MWRGVDSEIIVLDKRSWTYMGVNGSGAVLWKAMASGATLTDMTACLCNTFEVSRETAVQDVEAFLTLLESHDLLETSG